jgi:hypothetical protein
VCTYALSAWYYPGGHHWDHDALGFHWLHNYGCDLLDPFTHSLRFHSTFWLARVGLLGLLIGLGIFFISLPWPTHPQWRVVMIAIKSTGLISMISAGLMFSPWHDASVIVAFCFLLISISGLAVLYGLNQSKSVMLRLLPAYGVGCLCFLMWITQTYLMWVPLLQKIAVAFFLYWVWHVHHTHRQTQRA